LRQKKNKQGEKEGSSPELVTSLDSGVIEVEDAPGGCMGLFRE
jgi:hypothetical protein